MPATAGTAQNTIQKVGLVCRPTAGVYAHDDGESLQLYDFRPAGQLVAVSSVTETGDRSVGNVHTDLITGSTSDLNQKLDQNKNAHNQVKYHV